MRVQDGMLVFAASATSRGRQRTERHRTRRMIACVHVEDSDAIQQLRADHVGTLVAPMDGMWESTVIAPATFWEIRDEGQRVGYVCLSADQDLLRFHLWKDYLERAQAIFHWIISAHRIRHAMTSTIEPLYFSLCLDAHSSITLHSYLFRDNQPRRVSSGLGEAHVRKAESSELDDLVRFYHANTESPGEWIEPFLRSHLSRDELFVLCDQHTLVAVGECIPSQLQPPYADLGMVVARSYRGRGVGSFLLTTLKDHCYAVGWKPICSCEASNHASKKAIERAGFISEHRIVRIAF